jgi:hypothetical protein
VLGKSKAAVAWPFNLLKDETLKLFREAQETKGRLMERSGGLAEGSEEPSETDGESGSAVDQREYDHREYFRNLIKESNKRSGLGTS